LVFSVEENFHGRTVCILAHLLNLN
jgi:hypothetical protein